MKIILQYPDEKRTTVRLAATKRVENLMKYLPDGVYMKRKGRRVGCMMRPLKDVFVDGDVIDVVFKKTKSRVLKTFVPTSSSECMITLDTDADRAQMPCGHAITPQALYEYSTREAEQGRPIITCPYLDSAKGSYCGAKWSIDILKSHAALSKEERINLEIKLAQNKIKQQKIKHKVKVPDEIMISLLHRSTKKNILNFRGCPARRACPKCWGLIDHIGGCREITCKYPSCQFTFCFVCLRDFSGCDGNCTVAPMQFL